MKKKTIVLARNKKIAEQGIELEGERMDFHRGSALWVGDEGKARAIAEKYPRDVAVTQDQQYTYAANNEGSNGTRMDNIHHYTFGAMTSPAAEDFWKRYEKKKKAKQKPIEIAKRARKRGGKNVKHDN